MTQNSNDSNFIASLDFLDLEKLSKTASELDKILGHKSRDTADNKIEVEIDE